MKRTALVTGASAGLGREFASQLAAQGLDLVLVARRRDKLLALAGELSARHGVQAHAFAADLSRRDAPAAVSQFTRERGIAVDWLVNNAGAAGPHLLDDDGWELVAIHTIAQGGLVAFLKRPKEA